jgi:hypothetical protein
MIPGVHVEDRDWVSRETRILIYRLPGTGSKTSERRKLGDATDAVADYCPQQVEPQEKKKLPKGRARKRQLYIRRFVNVTLTGGKRKVRDDRAAFPTQSHAS